LCVRHCERNNANLVVALRHLNEDFLLVRGTP
jgi:hypothetical protein